MRFPVAAALAAAAAAQMPSYLGNFSSPNAGFLTILPLPSPLGPSLVVSAFTGNPFASDEVDVVYGVGSQLGSFNRIVPAPLTKNVTWPNEVTNVPTGAAPPRGWESFGAGFVVAGGFLVPPKTVGAVTAVQVDASSGGSLVSLTPLSVPSGNAILGGYFYHRALLADVDGDGIVDILAARATKPLIGAPNGQLVWLRNPGGPDPLSQAPWAEAVLTNGSWSPDVLYALASIRADADMQLFFTSFFTGGGLGMVQCAGCSPSGQHPFAWSNASHLTTTVLDASIGPSFDVQVIDLNLDGRLDLLVTNHVDNATDGGTPQSGVFAYEAPATGPLTDASAWTKHTLVSGFAVREWGPNQAAPGAFKAFQPCAGDAGQKPVVVVGGDGDQRAYILSPLSQSPGDWTYGLVELFDCKGTVGQPAVGDTDGDGCVEVFVPCYDSGVVHGWRYAAAAAA